MDEEKLFSNLEAILKNLEEMNIMLKKIDGKVFQMMTLSEMDSYIQNSKKNN